MASCTFIGCEKPRRARGLCSTHYNQRFPSPNRRRAPVRTLCAQCGESCDKAPSSKYERRYCSLACRTADQFAEARGRKLLVRVGPSWPRRDLPPQHPARRPAPRRGARMFVSGPCAWCGEHFTIADQTTARYCSARCSGKAYEAKTGRFVVPPQVRMAIYERDGWMCQLCSGQVDRGLNSSDPWSATLDHIECQSWVLIPDHSPGNLRLAHRWCNSVRGDESRYPADILAA